MKQTDTYHRSRIEILSYIIGFSTTTCYNINIKGAFNYSADADRSFYFVDEKTAEIGSLVTPASAPFSKYYLSWLVDKKAEGFGGSFLLKSIEDGKLSWWTNIGLKSFSKEKTNEMIHWKFTDKQFEFWDKWKRACKKMDAYMTLPRVPDFTTDGGVILSTRTRLSFDDNRSEKKFENWKKVTSKQMIEFYLIAAKKP